MQNWPQQTSNPFQAFPWMQLLQPPNPQSLYAGNPFLNMYVPAPNPSALTLASQLPPAGPGGQPIPPAPPPTSATLTPAAAAPGAMPGAQAGLPPFAGMAPGIPGAGGAGLPGTGGAIPTPPGPPAPLPPAQFVAQQQGSQAPTAGGAPPPPATQYQLPSGAPAGTVALGNGWFMNPAWQQPMTAQQMSVMSLLGIGPQMGGGDRGAPNMGGTRDIGGPPGLGNAATA